MIGDALYRCVYADGYRGNPRRWESLLEVVSEAQSCGVPGVRVVRVERVL